MPIFLGAIVAIVAGIYLISTVEGSDGEPTLLDKLGDLVSTFTSTEESRLSDLQPDVAAKVRELATQLETEDGIKIHIGQTLRTPAQEKANIAAGKTAATLVYSWHEIGRAVDVIPLDENGQPDWDAVNLDAYRTMHARAVALGFRSLAFNADGSKHLIINAHGKPIWDGGHIEWREPYATIAQAINAEGPKYGIT